MATPPKLYVEKHVKTAEAFLDQLSPNHVSPLWDRPDVDGWIFRGVRDASWSLQPSAFRIDEKTGNPAFTKFKPGQLREPPYATLEEQIDNEEHFALMFASRASQAGFEVPGDRPELRTPELAIDKHDGTEFPPVPQRWIYALAQHYGIPTRLLDWTTRPLVAAYFAAETASRRITSGGGANGSLAVWAVSRAFVEKVASKWDPGPTIITAPTTSNPNLHAQGGLFTLVRYSKSAKKVEAQPPTLDALFRDPKNRAACLGSFRQPMLLKFTLPLSEARVLLHYLLLHGIDAASIYPGLDSVCAAMQERWLSTVDRPSRHRRRRSPRRRPASRHAPPRNTVGRPSR